MRKNSAQRFSTQCNIVLHSNRLTSDAVSCRSLILDAFAPDNIFGRHSWAVKLFTLPAYSQLCIIAGEPTHRRPL